MKVKELIEELSKRDSDKEVQIKDTIYTGCRKEKDDYGESNTPFFDNINIPIQTVEHENDITFIRINRYN